MNKSLVMSRWFPSVASLVGSMRDAQSAEVVVGSRGPGLRWDWGRLQGVLAPL